ncbi:MAG: cytochrome c [Chloroflexota bacterium]|nr:cytochrome c [Chloroflexota bacterium]
MARRTAWALIKMIVLLLLLSGCGGMGRGDTPPASPSPATSPTPQEGDITLGWMTPSPFPPPLDTPSVEGTPIPSPTPPTTPAPDPTPVTPVAAQVAAATRTAAAADAAEREETEADGDEELLEEPEEEAQEEETEEEEAQEEEEEEAAEVDLAHGEQVYADNCAVCHGSEGEGRGGNPPHRNNPFVTGDPEPVIEVVLHGRGGMPAFGDQLSDQEIADVISYIRTAWTNDAEPVTPEQVAEVRDDE